MKYFNHKKTILAAALLIGTMSFEHGWGAHVLCGNTGEGIGTGFTDEAFYYS